MSVPPSPSLFVQNIPDKVVKKYECRLALHALFGIHGKVIDVVHTRRPKVRGTAFVVFRDLTASTAALRALNGEVFFGRPLKITYAKSVSHATIEQNEGPEAVYAIKAGIDTTRGSKLTVSNAQRQNLEKKRARDESDDEDNKRNKTEEEEEDDDAMAIDSDSDEEKDGNHVPTDTASSTLLAQGLPSDVTSQMMTSLFEQYKGLSSVRILTAGSAIVVFQSISQAKAAKEGLDGFTIKKGSSIQVFFAAKA